MDKFMNIQKQHKTHAHERTEKHSEQAKTNELTVTHILFLEIVDYVFVLWTWLHLKKNISQPIIIFFFF